MLAEKFLIFLSEDKTKTFQRERTVWLENAFAITEYSHHGNVWGDQVGAQSI